MMRKVPPSLLRIYRYFSFNATMFTVNLTGDFSFSKSFIELLNGVLNYSTGSNQTLF